MSPQLRISDRYEENTKRTLKKAASASTVITLDVRSSSSHFAGRDGGL